jgi:putative sigma-54 modulation protein
MEIKIESPHFTVGEQLNDYIINRVGKLEHLNERLIRSEVCLKLDKSATDDNKICEIRLVGPQKNLFASTRCMTFEDAVVETVHALEKQMGKEKTKNEKGREKMEVSDSSEEETNE